MHPKTRWLLRLAGIYGILVLTPLYFQEVQLGRDQPPAITHPEFFYGFIGLALVWQGVFLLMSTDPIRYRVLFPFAVLEKLSFGLPAVILSAQGRLHWQMLVAGSIDLALGMLFLIAYVGIRQRSCAIPYGSSPPDAAGGELVRRD